MKIRTLLGGLVLAFTCTTANATILTFDIAGISNGQNVNQGYGDAVTNLVMGSFGYGVSTEGFTPNVQASYGSNDPSLWTTGYGVLQNILYENQDSSGILRITLTADPGFNVVLHAFSLAAFTSSFSSDPLVQSIDVTDGGSTSYFSTQNFSVSRTFHSPIDFLANPIIGNTLVISIDARNLGSLNDDIGLDNMRFGQQAVPEPGTLAVVAVGALGWIRRRNRKSKA